MSLILRSLDDLRLSIHPILNLFTGEDVERHAIVSAWSERRMSLREYRSSPSTVQFTYSVQPRPSSSLPNVSCTVDLLSSILKSTLILSLAQWSTTHFHNNKILGPILRYIWHLIPYTDIRILNTSKSLWEITPWGIIAILCFALFLFFSKSTPIGNDIYIYTF